MVGWYANDHMALLLLISAWAHADPYAAALFIRWHAGYMARVAFLTARRAGV